MSNAEQATNDKAQQGNSLLFLASKLVAIIGGLIMLMIAAMVVSSIIGRVFFSTSVTGDYELVEMGLGISIFCFLPYCHLQRGHVIVDIFTASASPRTLLWLTLLSDTLMCLVSILLSWRLALGAQDAYDYFDYSMILQLPNWVVYCVGSASFGLLTINCLDSILLSMKGFKHE